MKININQCVLTGGQLLHSHWVVRTPTLLLVKHSSYNDGDVGFFSSQLRLVSTPHLWLYQSSAKYPCIDQCGEKGQGLCGQRL